MGFPTDWPAGCPPDDAEEASGPVFRLVKANPPEVGDFKTHRERGVLVTAPACLRCGLSLFRTRADTEHQHRAYPMLGRYIASGILSAEDGVVKLTQSRQPTHTTWWPFEGIDRKRVFELIEEIF